VIRTILQCTLVRISDRPGIIGYTGGAQNSAAGGRTVRVIRSRCPADPPGWSGDCIARRTGVISPASAQVLSPRPDPRVIGRHTAQPMVYATNRVTARASRGLGAQQWRSPLPLLLLLVLLTNSMAVRFVAASNLGGSALCDNF
jgi:hypothetical protein